MTAGAPNRAYIVIAHRGASASAPENTLPAYERALEQGADCIELDLHATRDNALVCIHDRSIERTTNVRDRFPERGREVRQEGAVRRRWFVHDFALSELRRLDCGAWFGPAYAGTRIQTFEDALDWARGRTAILAELKAPEVYATLGVDLLSLFDAAVRRQSLVDVRSADSRVTVQSFHEPTVRRAGAIYRDRLPVVLLRQGAEVAECASRDRLAAIACFAVGIAPEKSELHDVPHVVKWAHEAGLRVMPWTFRESSPGGFENVRAEMAYYVRELEVDGVITDHPDQAAGLEGASRP